MTTSAEYSNRTGLVKGATNDFQDKITGAHLGSGAQDFTVTLTKGTTRWIRKIEIAGPSFTGDEVYAIYNGSVATGNLVKQGYLLPTGEVVMRNPVSTTGNYVIRVTSTHASAVYINADYDYA